LISIHTLLPRRRSSGRCTAVTLPRNHFFTIKSRQEPKWLARFLPYFHFTLCLRSTHLVSDLFPLAHHLHCITSSSSHPTLFPYVKSITVLRIIPSSPLAFPDVSVFCFVFRTGLSYRSIFLLAICQALSSFDVLQTFAPRLTIILLSRHAFSFPSAAFPSSF